ncbi:MAG: hypothetical protein ACXAEN_22280 [Candidatus Thorarchaeota archaeon]|jgi:hypothetical protein
MAPIGDGERHTESNLITVVWYQSYAFLLMLSLILLYVIFDILLYLYAFSYFDIIYMLVSSLIWFPMLTVLLLFYSPLRVGASEEGVHVDLPFRKKVIRWEDIKFIGRSVMGLSNKYGIVAVFDVHDNVHVTGKFSSKVLDDLNSELRKHRAVSS